MAAKSGSNIGGAAGAIREFVRRGMSGRKALEAFRAAGGSMRDSYFRAQYKTIRDAMAKSVEISQLPGHRIPGAEHFAQWRAGKGGKHVYQGILVSRDEGGDTITEHKWTITSDKAISINKALRMMQAQFDDGLRIGSGEGEVFQSATITGLYKTVPFDE